MIFVIIEEFCVPQGRKCATEII